jgi:hypothetical protein
VKLVLKVTNKNVEICSLQLETRQEYLQLLANIILVNPTCSTNNWKSAQRPRRGLNTPSGDVILVHMKNSNIMCIQN